MLHYLPEEPRRNSYYVLTHLFALTALSAGHCLASRDTTLIVTPKLRYGFVVGFQVSLKNLTMQSKIAYPPGIGTTLYPQADVPRRRPKASIEYQVIKQCFELVRGGAELSTWIDIGRVTAMISPAAKWTLRFQYSTSNVDFRADLVGWHERCSPNLDCISNPIVLSTDMAGRTILWNYRKRQPAPKHLRSPNKAGTQTGTE